MRNIFFLINENDNGQFQKLDKYLLLVNKCKMQLVFLMLYFCSCLGIDNTVQDVLVS